MVSKALWTAAGKKMFTEIFAKPDELCCSTEILKLNNLILEKKFVLQNFNGTEITSSLLASN